MSSVLSVDEIVSVQRPKENNVRVALVDHDPISRHVLTKVLRKAHGIDVVEYADDPERPRQWTSDRVDVAVLSIGRHEGATRAVHAFAERKLRVLVVGIGWSRQQVDEMFHAGAAGCVVKDTRVHDLVAAVNAVASGYLIMSPQLRQLYPAPSPTSTVHPQVAAQAHPSPDRLLATLTEREYEVLELLAEGWSTAEAAAQLSVSKATVKSHVSHTLTKLGVRNRLEAVLLVRRLLDRGHVAVPIAGTGPVGQVRPRPLRQPRPALARPATARPGLSPAEPMPHR